MTKFWSIAGLLSLPSAGLAQEAPLVTDRPDFTESAAVPGRGRWQVEGGWTVEGSDRVRAHSLGEILLRIGIGDHLEGRIEPGSWVGTDDGAGGETSGIDDAGLGLKLLLFDGGPAGIYHAALLVSLSVPTGDDEIGEPDPQPEARLALGWTLSEAWSLGANVGGGRPIDGGEPFRQALGSVSLGRALNASGAAFVELYGLAPADPTGRDAAVLNGGFTLALGADAQLDARVGAGLGDAAPDWLFGLGIARRW